MAKSKLIVALFALRLGRTFFLCPSEPEPRAMTPPTSFPKAAAAQARGPDLSVVIVRSGSDARPFAAPGQMLTLSIGVANLNGDAAAHFVVLTVKLPSGLNFQNASPAPTGINGSTLVWNLGTIAPHAFPQTFDLNLAVATNAPPELRVLASVTSSDQEQNLENNNDTLPIVVRSGGADLAVHSTLDAVAVTVSKPTRFGISVSNEGNITATASVLTALLPQGVSLRSGVPTPSESNDGTVKWHLGDIGPGATRVIMVTVSLGQIVVPDHLGTSTNAKHLLTFSFDATTTVKQVNSTENHLEITKRVELAGADLRVWLDVSGAELPGVLPIGKDVMYTVLYGNFGNEPASGVSVSLNLAPGLNLTRAEPAATRTSHSDKSAGEVFEWDVGDLRVGRSKVINCRVHVNSVPKKGSPVKAAISFPGTDIDPSNNTASSRWYAPIGTIRGRQLEPPEPRRRRLFLWIAIIVIVLGFLLLALRRTKGRERS